LVQGIAVTPIQLIKAVGAIANGGVMVKPQVVKKLQTAGWVKELPPVTEGRVISQKAAGEMTMMMVKAAPVFGNQLLTVGAASFNELKKTDLKPTPHSPQRESQGSGGLPLAVPRIYLHHSLLKRHRHRPFTHIFRTLLKLISGTTPLWGLNKKVSLIVYIISRLSVKPLARLRITGILACAPHTQTARLKMKPSSRQKRPDSGIVKNIAANRAWLHGQMSPYFFQAMADEPEAMATLVRELGTLGKNRRLILSDRENRLILACVDRPGSLYASIQSIPVNALSYAMFSHSEGVLPNCNQGLEVQRFEFERKPDHIINQLDTTFVPGRLQRLVLQELATIAPGFDRAGMLRLLKILWLNNPAYLRISPPNRIARLLWLFDQSNASGGLFFNLSQLEQGRQLETRVLFAVGNPPQDDFLLQVAELFNRLNIGIRRAYCLTITNGTHPYFSAPSSSDTAPASSLLQAAPWP